MKKKLSLIIIALFIAAWHSPAVANSDSPQDEYKALKQQARKAGGSSKLAGSQYQRLLELKYMLGGDDGQPLPLKEARELAQLEITARKKGGISKLSEQQYQRLLALRIMKGDCYNQPLPPAEADEMALLQIKARRLGGESRLPVAANQRLRELRGKICRNGSANPFF